MLCVITMSTREGVKTQLVCKGQAFNTLEDLRFSLQGSWTYNLSTSAKFMSHWPMENINQSLPEAHHSMAANPVCKHFTFPDKHGRSFKSKRLVSAFPSIFFQSWCRIIYLKWQQLDSLHRPPTFYSLVWIFRPFIFMVVHRSKLMPDATCSLYL